MSAAPQWEPYRVITDAEALLEMFIDRIEDMNVSRITIDETGGFTPGYSAKLLCQPPMKTMANESFTRMLKATGIVLVAVVDDDRFAAIKEHLVKRRRRVLQANASKTRPTWLFTRKRAREMGKNRWSVLTDEQRTKLARKMQKASAAARRRKRQEADSLKSNISTKACTVPATLSSETCHAAPSSAA